MIGIVVQGPQRRFTSEIIDYYKSWEFPIIFSTYEDSILNIDYTIKLNKNFNHGAANRNAQRLTTYHGLLKAKELNLNYILKVRSDHIFRNLEYLYSFQELFKDKFVVGNAGSTYEEKWGKFHISDFWLFSQIDKLIEYFDINNPYWNIENNIHLSNCTSVEPELCQLWLKYKNLSYDSMDALLNDHFKIINNNIVNYNIPVSSILDITNWKLKCDPKTIESFI